MKKEEYVSCICVNVFKGKDEKDRKDCFNQIIANIISLDVNERVDKQFTHFKSSQIRDKIS